ncbi:MAG: zinc ribbon domain-containing protein [Pyrinomonadaceae bacterium]
MFCPGCGLEERQANQFCRACGTDLRTVRMTLERPDNITASAVSARDEIGRAVAAKIRETQTTYELKKVVEDVLPEIEKFLESPAEKRLRRMRVGTLISSIGAGAAIALTILGIFQKNEEMLFLAALGLVTFFIGLSFVLNSLLFSIPKKNLSDKSEDAASQRELDAHTNDLVLPEPQGLFTSVTEHTTKHLKEKHPVSRG